MYMRRLQKITRYACWMLCAFLLQSCVSSKDIRLLQERNALLPVYDSVAFADYRLQVNDEIVFRIITSNQEFATLVSGGQGVTTQQNASYRVFPDGTVDLPFLKAVPLVGLTLNEAAAELGARYRELVPDAMVKVVLANRNFTVIGQAGTGIYSMHRERLTLFQALSMSGELNLDADLSKVRIIRETGQGVKVLEFDIRPVSIIESQYYYVYPNDILYVQKNPSSFFQVTNYNVFLGIITSSVNLLLTVLYFFL